MWFNVKSNKQHRKKWKRGGLMFLKNKSRNKISDVEFLSSHESGSYYGCGSASGAGSFFNKRDGYGSGILTGSGSQSGDGWDLNQQDDDNKGIG